MILTGLQSPVNYKKLLTNQNNYDKIIEKRKETSHIGFLSEQKKGGEESDGYIADVQPQDLTKYGLIPEFVGRIPVTVSLHGLDTNALCRIMKEPKNAILKQYEALFSMDNIELEFSDDAIDKIAELTVERKTGARGLRSIIEEVMLDIMYEIPSQYPKLYATAVCNTRVTLDSTRSLLIL